MLNPAAAFLPQTQVLAGTIIFLASYVVFALGKFPGLKIDRTGAAIIWCDRDCSFAGKPSGRSDSVC